MSRRNNKKPKKTLLKTKKQWTIVIILCLVIAVAVAGYQYYLHKSGKNIKDLSSARLEENKDISINLGNGMSITSVGKYTGIYMEDGTDEIVSGVMMLVVKNEGQQTIQYAEITVPVGEKIAEFSLSTLPPGSSAILLEKNRMQYEESNYDTATAENVALFYEPLSLCEEQIGLQILDGAMNVKNISGKDINGDIMIYYKNSAKDIYYGGITYRAKIEGGLKEDEIKQVMTGHLSKAGSKIMFVTCGAER